MGMFDNITVRCNGCRALSLSQTKLQDCELHTFYSNGDSFEFQDCILELKDRCSCGHVLIVEVKDNRLYAPRAEDEATIRETQWGEWEEV